MSIYDLQRHGKILAVLAVGLALSRWVSLTIFENEILCIGSFCVGCGLVLATKGMNR